MNHAESNTRLFGLLFAGVGILCLGLSACGSGGPKGGNDDIKFVGTITRTSASTTTTVASALTERALDLSAVEEEERSKLDARAVTTCPSDGRDIDVCAQESCSRSSSKGDWSFSIAAFGGGDLEFQFDGCNLSATRTLRRISRNARTVTVAFTASSSTTVRATSVCQYDREGFPIDGTTSTCVVTTTTTLAG